MAETIGQEAVAEELVKFPEDTDSRDWLWAKKILYELNQPRVWSNICIAAFNKTDNPVLKIWFLLEHVNGWRRQIGKWDMQVAFEALDEIKRRIDRLPDDHPRKGRLFGLWLYHSAWGIYHPTGEFAKAAECHETAVERAEASGEKREESLSLYNAAYEWLNEAILLNKGIGERYGEFTKSACEFLDYLAALILEGAPSDNDVRWRANVLRHLAFYGWVVEGRYLGRPDVSFLYELPEALEPAFADAEVALRALCELSRYPGRAVEITSQISPAADPDWGSFAILVRISAMEKMGKTEEAQAAREELDEFFKDKHGGHVAKAILDYGLLK
ncbi:MAG: hypothetical protein PHZ04_00470 [Patescibacteria group bacterium]|nr:hypothetical protein [Patescibacteria group bacterium]MDD5294765.1 hypothetical protein [Patescibacteria group bacterium]MDD5554760.1 hypothetical protein [Patescibacteria group bacterium]